MSLFESTTTALDAATVPAVIPSICSNSASLITALPIVKPVPVNPYNLKNHQSDMMKIAFAGPAANLLVAFLTL